MRARIAVDFDGTICADDFYPEIGPILPGAKEALERLSRLGDVVIFTCRTADARFQTEDPRDAWEVQADVDAIRAFFSVHGMPDYDIWQKTYKPPAAVYVDNRGVHFNGNWQETVEKVLDVIASNAVRAIESRPVARFFDDEELARVEGLTDTDVQEFYAANVAPRGATFSEAQEEIDAEFAKVYNEAVARVYGRHPNSQRFHDLLQEAGELHDQKQKDYGSDDDPFANIRRCERMGIPAWVGDVIRMGDKQARLEAAVRQWVEGREVRLANEGVVDSFADQAVYATIGRVLFEEWAEEQA